MSGTARPVSSRSYTILGHLPHGAARWSCRVNRLSKRLESNITRFQIIQQRYQVTQRLA